jgi:predicted RecA/RadA family phage recombinase
MAKNYVQDGDVIAWTNGGAAVASGDVVVIGSNGNAVIGIALVDIAGGASGSVAIDGVFSVPKVDAAVIAAGEFVTWDSSAGKFDDNLAVAAAGDVSGGAMAIESKGATTNATINVKLTGMSGTLA